MNRILNLAIALATCFSTSSSQEILPKAEMGDPPGIVEDPLSAEPGAPTRVPFSKTKTVREGFLRSYPSDARAKGVEGDVIVELWVDETGKPFRTTTIWGPKELRSYAETFCKEHLFAPYIEGGKAIPVRFRMMILFRLSSNGWYRKAPKEFKL
jgi:protein TonB